MKKVSGNKKKSAHNWKKSAEYMKSLIESKALLKTDEAATYLNSSPRFLEILRIKGGGPLFIQSSPKMIRYRIQDLDSWIADRVRRSTADDGAVA